MFASLSHSAESPFLSLALGVVDGVASAVGVGADVGDYEDDLIVSHFDYLSCAFLESIITRDSRKVNT